MQTVEKTKWKVRKPKHNEKAEKVCGAHRWLDDDVCHHFKPVIWHEAILDIIIQSALLVQVTSGGQAVGEISADEPQTCFWVRVLYLGRKLLKNVSDEQKML